MLRQNFTGLPILPLFPGSPGIPWKSKQEIERVEESRVENVAEMFKIDRKKTEKKEKDWHQNQNLTLLGQLIQAPNAKLKRSTQLLLQQMWGTGECSLSHIFPDYYERFCASSYMLNKHQGLPSEDSQTPSVAWNCGMSNFAGWPAVEGSWLQPAGPTLMQPPGACPK